MSFNSLPSAPEVTQRGNSSQPNLLTSSPTLMPPKAISHPSDYCGATSTESTASLVIR